MRLYTDGGSRGNDKGEGNGVGAGAWLIVGPDDVIIKKDSEFYGTVTNNEAEYYSLIRGFKCALQAYITELTCYSDSLLLINQMKGTYKIKKESLKILSLEAKKLELRFIKVRYVQVPRTNPFIRTADRLLNKVLDDKMFG